MANYQVLFSGEVAQQASIEMVRENLARELGLDERKAKQLFSGCRLALGRFQCVIGTSQR